ncbi:hypothetical protein N9544_04985 [Flavobacteriales bacterium]|nr:hypothetical protein [Flavobacteriales bacterium]
MKNILLLSLSLVFSFLTSQNTLSQSNSNKEKTLCKTWYVDQAFEIKNSGRKEDQTEQARGTEFIFKEDYSFDFNMKSEDRNKLGAWKFITQDSLSLDLQNHKIIFFIQYFSSDSMYLIGKDDPNSSMHIKFSSTYVAPIQKLDYYSDDTDIEEDAVSVNRNEPLETIDYKEKASIKLSKEEIIRMICNTWYLQNANLLEGDEQEEIDETEEIVFIFNKNQTFKITEKGESEELGKWEVLNNLTLDLEVEKEIINFKIFSISEDILIISGEKKGVIMKLRFKTKNK